MERPGLIDLNDTYMAIREDDYPGAIQDKLKLANFKKEKTLFYQSAQDLINQGLVIFPNDLNVRNEMEFTEVKEDGTVNVRFEKATFEEINSLSQLSLLKEEMTGMQKTKKENGTIIFEQTIEAKASGKHDDRVDALCLCCYELMLMRQEEALAVTEKPKTQFKEMLKRMQANNSKRVNNSPFGNINSNPFGNNKLPGSFGS